MAASTGMNEALRFLGRIAGLQLQERLTGVSAARSFGEQRLTQLGLELPRFVVEDRQPFPHGGGEFDGGA